MKTLGSYLTGGLADILRQINRFTKFSNEKKISKILIETEYYRSSNLNDFFDFSNYPVDVVHVKNLKDENFDYFLDSRKSKTFCKECLKNKKSCIFLCYEQNPNKENMNYIFDRVFGEKYVLRKLKLTNYFIENFFTKKKEIIKENKYAAFHLRTTDRAHEYSRHNYKNKESFLLDVVYRIENLNLPVFLATDDFENLNFIKKHTKKEFLFNDFIKKYKNNDKKNLHICGDDDPEILFNSLIDLFILAGSDCLFTSTGNFSNLAWQLWQDQKLYNNLLNTYTKETNKRHVCLIKNNFMHNAKRLLIKLY